MRAGQRSRCSDWLRAGRSGDRIPVGAKFSAPVQTVPEPHPASCTMGTGSFPRVKSGRGVTLTPHPHLVPLVMKEQKYTSTLPVGLTACTKPQCLYKGALYFYVVIYIFGIFKTHTNIKFLQYLYDFIPESTYTGLFKMIVGVLTTCHTKYT